MPEPIVLLHGLGMSGRAWLPVLPGLRAGHGVHALTLPGHRGGPPAPAAASLRSLTDVVQAQIDALGHDRVHLAGNSLGGWIALELARRGRARSVTAFAPAGAWLTPAALRRLEIALRGGGMLLGNPFARVFVVQPQTRRALLRGLIERGDRLTPGEALEMLRDLRGCTVLRDVLRFGRRDGSLERFESPDCPVRIVWGRRDRTLPFQTYGRPVMERIPAATLTMLPQAGHVPMYDCPDRVTRLILDQIDLVNGRPSSGSKP